MDSLLNFIGQAPTQFLYLEYITRAFIFIALLKIINNIICTLFRSMFDLTR